MSKQLYPNIVRGGVALPLGNNYYFMKGRKHKQGGIDVGKDLEVEDGEIMKVSPKEVKVFSSVPFLNGQSPVEKLLGGENPNRVFAQQERFKKVNKIKDDGTKAKLGKGKKITTQTIPESEQYAVTTPDGQRKVFNTKEEAQQYITTNTPKGYSLYDTTNYGSNIDKSQTAILNRNTEREVEKATEKEKLAAARLVNRQQNNENAKEILSTMPVIGDGMDLYSIAKDVYNKNYGNAALTAGMMLVPFDKLLKSVGKGVKKLFNKTNKKSNVKFTDDFDVNSDNKSYEELAEEYTDDWFDNEIESSNDINNKNLQNITDEKWDELYNKAIKNNNLEEAQNLKDLHFKQKAVDNKNNKTQFHGVSSRYNPNFTIFDPKENHKSIFTSDNIDLSSSYVTEFISDDELKKFAEKDKYYRKKYLKSKEFDIKNELELIGEVDKNDKVSLQSLSKRKQDLENIQYELQTLENNPVKYYKRLYGIYPERIKQLNSYLKNPLIINAEDNYWSDIPIDQLSKDIQNKIKIDPRSGKYSTLSLENVSRELGYDGVIINNVLDYGGHGINKYIDLDKPSQVVITNNPNNLKLADVITYDDNKDIIPLSKRDDFTNSDMRYNWLLPTIGVGTGLSLMNNENNQYKYGGKMKKQLGGIEYIYNRINKSDKNFAKRLRDKNRKYITNWEDTTQISTHKLGVATDNKGNHYIYPEVQEVNGQLVDYTRPPFNKTAGVINAEKTGDTIRVNSIKDGVKFTQEYKNRYMDKKQMGGKANIYRVDSNGKTSWRMNTSTGEELKARKKALFGDDYKFSINKDNYDEIITYTPSYNPSKDKLFTQNDFERAFGQPITTKTKLTPEEVTYHTNNYNNTKTVTKSNYNNILNNFTTSDYIGLGANVAGSIISGLINNNTLNKYKYSRQPTFKIANKLKTTYNINPQLDTAREQLNKSLRDVDQNTSSSATALNRKNKLRLANIMNTNQLFATKENLETELINKDKLNQQGIANTNIDNYNKWIEGEAAFRNAILDKKAENRVSVIQNIAQGITNTLSNKDKRRATQNNIISILAANPNVNPEYLRSLGADWVTKEMIENWKRANNK